MSEQLKTKYSIILPVRNGGDYVKLCIKSILSQTLRNFNLIVLDNCSSDGTSEYIKSVQDERVVIYPSSKPLTIEENWGRITTLALNEYITLIGHDDILSPDYLAEMEDLIRKYPQASLYQTHYSYINREGGVLRKCKPMAEIEDGPSFLTSFLQFKIDIMGTGFMMRSLDFKRLGGIPAYPNLILADLELWIKLTSLGFKATSAKECFCYRVHQSTTLTTPNLRYQQAYERFFYFLVSLRQQSAAFSGVISAYGKTYLLYQCRALCHRLMQSPKNKNDGLSVKIVIQKFKGYAHLLGYEKDFKPTILPTVFITKVLDSNAIGRLVFLVLDAVYNKMRSR